MGVDNEVLADTFDRVKASMAIVDSVASLGKGFQSLFTLLPKVKTAVAALNTTLLANPILLVVVAISALLLAFSKLTNQTSSQKKYIDGLNENYKKFTDTLDENQKALEKETRILKASGATAEEMLEKRKDANKDLTENLKTELEKQEQLLKTANKKEKKIIEEHIKNIKERQAAAAAMSEGLEIQSEELSLKRKQEEADKQKEIDNKAADAAKKFREDEKNAAEEYQRTLTEIVSDGEERRASVLQGKDRLEWLEKQIEKNRKLSQSYLEAATHEKSTAQERNNALQEYQKIIQQTGSLLDEYNGLALETTTTERVKGIEVEISANNRLIVSLQEAVAQEEIGSEARKELEEKLNTAFMERVRLQEDLTLAQSGYEEKLAFIDKEVTANQELIESLRRIVDTQVEGSQERISAQNQLNEATALHYQLTQQQKELEAEKLELDIEANQQRIEQETEINQQRRDLEEALQLAKNPENLTQDQILEKHEAEIKRLWDIAENTELSYEERKKALTDWNKANEEANKLRKKIEEEEKQDREKKLKGLASFFAESSDLLGENTVAGKAMAVAGATINTYLAGAQALATYPPPISYMALATTIATGLSTVKNILSTKVPGASDTTSAATNADTVSMPSMPEMDTDIVETHNNFDAYDEDMLNQQPVLVVEDVNEVQTRVKVAENNATF
ncbi:MAG: hypothetical protein LUF85_06550 [Bacteroides sp.]|nr:hypothetical protein [Bacteroides sp.]